MKSIVAQLLIMSFILTSCGGAGGSPDGGSNNEKDDSTTLNLSGTVTSISSFILNEAVADSDIFPGCKSTCKKKNSRCATLLLLTSSSTDEKKLCDTEIDINGHFNFVVTNKNLLKNFMTKITIENFDGTKREILQFVDPEHTQSVNLEVTLSTTAAANIVKTEFYNNPESVKNSDVDHGQNLKNTLKDMCPGIITENNVLEIIKTKMGDLSSSSKSNLLIQFRKKTASGEPLLDIQLQIDQFCSSLLSTVPDPSETVPVVPPTLPENPIGEIINEIPIPPPSNQLPSSAFPLEVFFQWVKSIPHSLSYDRAIQSSTMFRGIVTDLNGNSYAVGHIAGVENFNLSDGVTAISPSIYSSAILVKYNSSGIVQWAKNPSEYSAFISIAIDKNSGEIYVVGTSKNGFTSIIKYSSNGDILYTKSINYFSLYSNITLDSSGNFYVVGSVPRNGIINFGNNVTATAGTNGLNYDAVVVKYNSAGVAQWARVPSVTSPEGFSKFKKISIGVGGNIYIIGETYGNAIYDFNNGVTLKGSGQYVFNMIIVKYNESGVAQWAKSATTPIQSSHPFLNDVSTDSLGNVYIVGSISNSEYDFGNGVIIGGIRESGFILKYNSSGIAQWAKLPIANRSNSGFENLAVDIHGDIYVSGYTGVESYDFGNGITSYFSNPDNIILLKYNSSGIAQWIQSPKATSGTENGPSKLPVITSLSVDNSGNTYAAGYLYGNVKLDFGNGTIVSQWSPYGGNATALLMKYGPQ